MDQHQFLHSYLDDFSDLVKPDQHIIEQLTKVATFLTDVHMHNKNTLIFDSGGSANISSHFSVDLTKNASSRCVDFNESDLMFCFSNDYGYERWVEKAVNFYGDEGDLLIVISSSGSSENMLNGVQAACKGSFKGVVTLSGFAENNPLRKLGDINLWMDSKAYNFVENIHQVWLLAIVDLIIGKWEYSA